MVDGAVRAGVAAPRARTSRCRVSSVKRAQCQPVPELVQKHTFALQPTRTVSAVRWAIDRIAVVRRSAFARLHVADGGVMFGTGGLTWHRCSARRQCSWAPAASRLRFDRCDEIRQVPNHHRLLESRVWLSPPAAYLPEVLIQRQA